MENRWLLTWVLAPLFSPAATAVEAYSLRWYKLDAETPPARQSTPGASGPRALPVGMYALIAAAAVALLLITVEAARAQSAPGTLVAIFAHADDEGAAAPVLARYAREGNSVYLVIATDGAQGGAHTSIPRGPELARVRSEEARCSTDALGVHPPILLGFPDAQLGSYADESTRLFRLTDRLHEQLQRLRPDALLTWGPDGGTGHPDHRLVSGAVTQLVRAGAPGVPERLFYVSLPIEGMRAMNPSRGEPAFLVPLAKYFTMRVAFTPADVEASRRAMACHRTQYSDDVVRRVAAMQERIWNGELSFVPYFSSDGGTDLLRR